MIVFRHCDSRYPFLWEAGDQPPGRWHGPGEGPVHYLADTPDAAWAEFLRHEEIVDPADLETVTRALWAVEIPEDIGEQAMPRLPMRTLVGDRDSYPSCRAEAARLRSHGHASLSAPSAALLPGSGGGWRVDGGRKPGPRREGQVVVLFGRRPDLVGWAATVAGRPGEDLLPKVRHFGR